MKGLFSRLVFSRWAPDAALIALWAVWSFAVVSKLDTSFVRTAYEGYAAFTGGKTFDALPDRIKGAWCAALVAVEQVERRGNGREMTFGQAIEVLKSGGTVAREGWNGKGMWLVLIRAGNAMHTSARGAFTMSDCLGMKTAGGDMQPGWLASQADMLAEDWVTLS